MDSGVKIEPRFENPDGEPLPAPLTAAPASKTVVLQSSFLSQNVYIIGGCLLFIFALFLVYLYFKKSSAESAPQHQPSSAQTHHPAPTQQASSSQATAQTQQAASPAPTASPTSQAPQTPAAQSAAQSPAAQAQQSAASDSGPENAPSAAESSAEKAEQYKQELQRKLSAVKTALQTERTPSNDVSTNELDLLMESPDKKPESQDLAIGNLI